MKPSYTDATKIDFGANGVPAGATEGMTACISAPFLGQKLVVTRGMEAFDLIGLEINGVECLPCPEGGVPCIAFAADAVGNGLLLPVASPGPSIRIRVRNTSSEPANFFAGLIGQMSTIPSGT